MVAGVPARGSNIRDESLIRRAAHHPSTSLRRGSSPRGDRCKTKERFANAEPVPGSLARTCPRSFDFVRVAHFAQDDTHWHQAPFWSLAKVFGGRRTLLSTVSIDGGPGPRNLCLRARSR